MVNTNTQKVIAWLTGILTLALALFSFILSFNALTDLARQHGISIPPLFPFVVEFAVIIFSLNALYRSLSGEPATVQWALIIGSSVLAGIFNIAHAQADAISRLMAAMPSLFLLLSFESFLSLVKFNVTRQEAIQTLDTLTKQAAELDRTLDKKTRQETELNEELDHLVARIYELKQDIAKTDGQMSGSLDKANDTRQAKIDERRQDVLNLLTAGRTEQDIAEALNVSVRTIRRDIKNLNGQVRVTG